MRATAGYGTDADRVDADDAGGGVVFHLRRGFREGEQKTGAGVHHGGGARAGGRRTGRHRRRAHRRPHTHRRGGVRHRDSPVHAGDSHLADAVRAAQPPRVGDGSGLGGERGCENRHADHPREGVSRVAGGGVRVRGCDRGVRVRAGARQKVDGDGTRREVRRRGIRAMRRVEAEARPCYFYTLILS